MRRALLAVSGALVIGIATGCGGTASSSAPETGTTAPALTQREKEQIALRRYLAQSRVANGFYQRGHSIQVRAVDLANGSADASVFSTAAAQLKTAEDLSSEASVRQRLTQPPPALRPINRSFARAIGRTADLIDAQADALLRNDIAAYNAVSFDATTAVRNEWRIQVSTQCRRLGVPLPAWARRIGKRHLPED